MLAPEPDLGGAFVLAHTAWTVVPMVPELSLQLATEATPLWHATSTFLEDAGIEPPYWAFAWPGGVALARYVLDHPESVRDLRVVDVASGSGLCALACARAGARHVTALDVDPLASAACAINARGMGLSRIETERARAGAGFDRACDVIVAGDVFYDREMSEAMTVWLTAARARGVRVLVGDPGRTYAPAASSALKVLARYDVPTLVDLEGVSTKSVRVLEWAP